MTVIVGAQLKGGGVVLAADSAVSSGWEKMLHDGSKLWTSSPYVLGGAGCLRTIQVAHHFASWPKYRPDEDTDTEVFLVKSVVPAFRSAFKDSGTVTTTNGAESVRAELVIAWADNLASIAGNGCVVVPRSGRCAIGSGYAEALGYLGDVGPWTVAQVVEAARRATITARGVDGPIDYVTTKGAKIVRGAA